MSKLDDNHVFANTSLGASDSSTFIRTNSQAKVKPLTVPTTDVACHLGELFKNLTKPPKKLQRTLQICATILRLEVLTTAQPSYTTIDWPPSSFSLTYDVRMAKNSLECFPKILVSSFTSSKYSKKHLQPLALARDVNTMASFLYHVLEEVSQSVHAYGDVATQKFAKDADAFLAGDGKPRRVVFSEELRSFCRTVLVLRSAVEGIVSLASFLKFLPTFRDGLRPLGAYVPTQNLLAREKATKVLELGASSVWEHVLVDPSCHRLCVFHSSTYTLPVHSPGYSVLPPLEITNIALEVHCTTVNVFLVFQLCSQFERALMEAARSPDFSALLTSTQINFKLVGSPTQSDKFRQALAQRREFGGDMDDTSGLMRTRVPTLCALQVTERAQPTLSLNAERHTGSTEQ